MTTTEIIKTVLTSMEDQRMFSVHSRMYGHLKFVSNFFKGSNLNSTFKTEESVSDMPALSSKLCAYMKLRMLLTIYLKQGLCSPNGVITLERIIEGLNTMLSSVTIDECGKYNNLIVIGGLFGIKSPMGEILLSPRYYWLDEIMECTDYTDSGKGFTFWLIRNDCEDSYCVLKHLPSSVTTYYLTEGKEFPSVYRNFDKYGNTFVLNDGERIEASGELERVGDTLWVGKCNLSESLLELDLNNKEFKVRLDNIREVIEFGKDYIITRTNINPYAYVRHELYYYDSEERVLRELDYGKTAKGNYYYDYKDYIFVFIENHLCAYNKTTKQRSILSKKERVRNE